MIFSLDQVILWWSIQSLLRIQKRVLLFPWTCSTLFHFSSQFGGLENFTNFDFITHPLTSQSLASMQTHTHMNRAWRETTGGWRTLHLQLEPLNRQDFTPNPSFNFSLPRGEDVALVPAQHPRANASISYLCLPIHYDYEYFKKEHRVCLLARLEPVRRLNSSTHHLIPHDHRIHHFRTIN